MQMAGEYTLYAEGDNFVGFMLWLMCLIGVRMGYGIS